MAAYNKEQVETSSFELSREAEEAAIKARNLRKRIEKFFARTNESDKGDSEEESSENELTTEGSHSIEEQYSLLEAIEQLEGAARALKEVSLESSKMTIKEDVENPREPIYQRDNAKVMQSEESVRSQCSEGTGTNTENMEIYDYDLEVLTSFRPSKALREKLLQNFSQRRWRNEALKLVHESKHLTMLWTNTF